MLIVSHIHGWICICRCGFVCVVACDCVSDVDFTLEVISNIIDVIDLGLDVNRYGAGLCTCSDKPFSISL